MKKTSKKYFGFTLVELIIVITILAILSTVAFVSFQGYTKSARDGVRLENLSNIEKGLEVFNVKSGTYPLPDNKITISLSGSNISHQGTLGETSSKIIGFGKTPTDPLDNSNYYYSTNTNQKGYSLLGFGENQTAFIQDKTFADNSTKSTLTKGNLSYILDKDNNTLTSDTDLFLTGSLTVYNQIINNSKKLSGSGITLGGGYQMLAIKNGDYSAPKSCPDGFIPVVGSADFSQPGFCVSKYEMSLKKDLSNSELSDTFNTWTGSITSKGSGTIWSDGLITSEPGKYPIANISQIQSISACKTIGGHIITNNEWMTIARQIENNSQNWSNGQVGSGYINQGITDSALGCSTSNTKTIYTLLPNGYASKTGPGFGINSEAIACDKKRQLTLSNGENIWDIAGNLWEHVNKSNTIDGVGYDVGKIKIDSNSINWNITNLGLNNEYYSWYKYGWDNSNITSENRKNYGPNNSIYGTGFGIGTIHGYFANDSIYKNNIFLRGGDAGSIYYAGIYALHLHWYGGNNYGQSVGFRCAY